MAEEHLHHLCIIFVWFREHNLKLKPSKCDFFRNEITYLAHQVTKDGVCPSNMNLKVIAECAPPQTYMEVHSFLGLVGHYWRFIKGFICIAQPLSDYLAGEGASRKSRVGVTYWGSHKGLWGIEMSVYDSTHPGVYWLHQTIPVRDWCI